MMGAPLATSRGQGCLHFPVPDLIKPKFRVYLSGKGQSVLLVLN